MAILLMAVGVWVQGYQRSRETRLAHFLGGYRAGAQVAGELAAEGTAGRDLALWLNRLLSRQDFVRRQRLDLVRAGIALKPTQFFLLRLAAALIVALLARIVAGSLAWWLQSVAMIVGGVAGYLLLRPYLTFRQGRRVATFEKHFGDALDVMVGALESGSSLSSAIELVSREMPPPLSVEFARVLRDAGLGLSYEDAFKGLHERVPSEDVGMLVSAVSIQFRVGGNLAQVLKTLGETVRDRERIRGEIRTLTAQQKITGRLISGIPFVLVGVLMLINPDYMRHLFDPGLPRLLAAIAALMVGAGNLVLRRVLNIDV